MRSRSFEELNLRVQLGSRFLTKAVFEGQNLRVSFRDALSLPHPLNLTT